MKYYQNRPPRALPLFPSQLIVFSCLGDGLIQLCINQVLHSIFLIHLPNLLFGMLTISPISPHLLLYPFSPWYENVELTISVKAIYSTCSARPPTAHCLSGLSLEISPGRQVPSLRGDTKLQREGACTAWGRKGMLSQRHLGGR